MSVFLTVINCSRGVQFLKEFIVLPYKKMVCVGAAEPEHPRSVDPLPVKPKHHLYQRLHQYSESGAASDTSIQQRGASSGLDHATRSATTDNPQDGSPRSNHWLGTATSDHFRSTERGGNRSARRSTVKTRGKIMSGCENHVNGKSFGSGRINVCLSVAVSVSGSLCSCSACLAAQQRLA